MGFAAGGAIGVVTAAVCGADALLPGAAGVFAADAALAIEGDVVAAG